MWPILFLVISVAKTDENICKERCQRIHQRSLARVGFDDEKLREHLEKQRPLGTTRDICWRVYDYLDCMKHCGPSESHENFAKFIRSKCHFALKDIEDPLSCVSRYHSFMEVKCSTFLNEAERLKENIDPSLTPTQEICRFLHLNSLCLENTVTIHCENAKKIFRRLNFRDYFPSFILPTNDTLFDEIDLDACQMYDFVKKDIRRIEESQMNTESTAIFNFFQARDAVIPSIGKIVTADSLKERKEFTELLDELLDDSTTTFPQTTSLNSSTTTNTMVVNRDRNEEALVPITIGDTTETIPTTNIEEIERLLNITLNETETLPTTIVTTTKSISTTMKDETLLIPTITIDTTKTISTTSINDEAEAIPSTIDDSTEPTTTTIVSTTGTMPTITSTTIPITSTTTSSRVTEMVDAEDEYDDDIDIMENISVNVVSIQQKTSSIEADHSTTKEPIPIPIKSRLFNDDSWEQTPPNFRYSSLRFPNGGVTPLNIDTTTLFGFDDDHEGSDSYGANNSDDVNVDDELKQKAYEQTQDGSKMSRKNDAFNEKLELTFNDSPQMFTGNEEQRFGEIPVNGQSTPRIVSDENESTTSSDDLHHSEIKTSKLASDFINSQFLGDKTDTVDSTSSTSISVHHDEDLLPKIQGWNEFDRNHEYDIHEIVVASDDDGNDVEYFNAVDHHTVAPMILDDDSALTENRKDWIEQDTLLLIYCLLFGITILSLVCLLICLILCQKTHQLRCSKSIFQDHL